MCNGTILGEVKAPVEPLKLGDKIVIGTHVIPKLKSRVANGAIDNVKILRSNDK